MSKVVDLSQWVTEPSTPDEERPFGAKVLAAARLVTSSRNKTKGQVQVVEVARRFGLSTRAVNDGRAILRYGTPQQISQVENGVVGPTTLAQQLRAANGVKRTPRPPDAVERQRVAGQICRNLTTGLAAFSGLPAAADTVAEVRRFPRSAATVDRRLLSVQAWLEEFVDAWTAPEPAATNAERKALCRDARRRRPGAGKKQAQPGARRRPRRAPRTPPPDRG